MQATTLATHLATHPAAHLTVAPRPFHPLEVPA